MTDAKDSGRVSPSDVNYFGQFTEGYNPYSPADLDLIAGSALQLIGERQRQMGTNVRVMEVGCASGQFSSEVATRNAAALPIELFGLDIAQPVLAKYPFNRICGSAFAMPLPASRIDVVCCPASLHHLAPFADAIAEIDRVLAPGGVFFCVEPNLYHPQRRLIMQFPTLYRKYRDANDVPIRADWLARQFETRGYHVRENRYVNLTFAHPGMLQRLQNRLARGVSGAAWLHRFTLPWFIFAAMKTG
jgi:SAM-dependent methyltransferase